MLHSIKGICHIYFDYHSFLFICDIGVDSFLDQDYVVPNLSLSHEAPLIWENYPWEEAF